MGINVELNNHADWLNLSVCDKMLGLHFGDAEYPTLRFGDSGGCTGQTNTTASNETDQIWRFWWLYF